MAAQSEKLSFLGSISPWGPSRSTTPKPGSTSADVEKYPDGLGKQQGGDHAVNHRHHVSIKLYPRDCPALNVRWYYAVDVGFPFQYILNVFRSVYDYRLTSSQIPKRKPLALDKSSIDNKPAPPPKKFVAFSSHDSRSIEQSFQKLLDEEEQRASGTSTFNGAKSISGDRGSDSRVQQNSSINDAISTEKGGKIKVPVNEDYLFDVDIERRELAPTYWLGPIYEVRRGSWFYQEGSSLRPCEENLAYQLEEGYLKIKPWRSQQQGHRSVSQPRAEVTSPLPRENTSCNSISNPVTPRASAEDLRSSHAKVLNEVLQGSSPESPSNQRQLKTHRLFGTYMNTAVTYQNGTTAWLLSDDFLSRMSSTVYERFAGGGHLGGTKMIRGFHEPGKPFDTDELNPRKDGQFPATPDLSRKDDLDSPGRVPIGYKRRSAPPSTSTPSAKDVSAPYEIQADVSEAQLSRSTENSGSGPISETPRQALERQMSSMVISGDLKDAKVQEEEARKRDEEEIREDYRETTGEVQGREIEHLILVTHGIGQRLGLRMESVNFIHDVNVLRKTMKAVYGSSADLQALNSEVERLPKNCRLQVLPICWRHLLDFPKQRLKQNRKEQDVADADLFGEGDTYPSLDDITIEGVPAVRNLITDLALDILLYQSAYKEHIAGIVQRECNRVYHLFLDRNPSFQGRVSLVGHSLGSAILFDILCRQNDSDNHNKRGIHNHSGTSGQRHETENLALDFDVDSFFCIGSPIGLFQMLKGRTIAGRRNVDIPSFGRSTNGKVVEDPFLASTSSGTSGAPSSNDSNILTIATSSPKCQEFYNIFHPTDPISYRIEPLISPAMASLKPQSLPYTKKGIFGVPAQGLTGIGARVGQSVSGFWTNLASGVASSLLNRSLGLTGDDSISSKQIMVGPHNHPTRAPLSVGAGTNISAGGVIPSTEPGKPTAEPGQRPPTLIDSEIETLFAGFQKRRKSHQSDESRDLGESPEWQEADERAKRLKREEAKVRALNSHGRVDYSIQE